MLIKCFPGLDASKNSTWLEGGQGARLQASSQPPKLPPRPINTCFQNKESCLSSVTSGRVSSPPSRCIEDHSEQGEAPPWVWQKLHFFLSQDWDQEAPQLSLQLIPNSGQVPANSSASDPLSWVSSSFDFCSPLLQCCPAVVDSHRQGCFGDQQHSHSCNHV